MSSFNLLRKRASGNGGQVGATETDREDENRLPIPGYDKISNKHLIAELSKHTQAELAAIDTYERAHKNRTPVFHKLRYLRGPEPLQGYDKLSVAEILAGLDGADTQKLQKTRLYERKFQRRPDVLEKIAASLHDHLPASAHRDPPRATAAAHE
jgi:hypothetical protein